MGSVRKRGEVWYAKWNDAAGRCHEERTSARTKAEARGLVVELEHKVERQRRGLEPIPADCRTTLAELCDMYVSKWCSPTCRERERCRLAKHIQAWPISALPLPAVTTAAAEDHLAALEAKGLGANSVKHVRAVGCSMYNRARKLGIWTGPNPFSDTQPRRIPHRVYDTLSADEALLVLANVPAAWQGFFAAALFLGLRKGECAGLSKRDVSMEQGTITIRVSYDHDTTKGKHADVLPIPPPLLPFIEAGLATKGPYLFPAPDGSMRTEQSDPQLILRRVLCRVGLVLGWDHVCRRCKAARKEAHTWRHPDPAERVCPACGMKLWPTPEPRALRFHDLRHTAATLMLKAGVDPHRVQRIVRHGDVSTTTRTYAHLNVDDLRGAVLAPWLAPPVELAAVEREAAPKVAVGAESRAPSGKGVANGPSPSQRALPPPLQPPASALEKSGVSEGTRTLNTRSHSPVLYH